MRRPNSARHFDHPAFGYALLVVGLLWTTFAGLCQGLGVIAMFENPTPAHPTTWLAFVPVTLWVLPGVASMFAGVVTLRAARRARLARHDEGDQ